MEKINYILIELNDVEKLTQQIESGAPLKIGCGDSIYLGTHDSSGENVREGIVKVLEEYKTELRQMEKKEARTAVNTLIEYCDGCMSCDDCAIRDFCSEVRKNGPLFCDCPGYSDDEEGK